MTDERRHQPRFSLNLQAKISSSFVDPGAVELEYIETVAADISSGGAFLETEQKLPLASRVNIGFLLSIDDLKKLKFILSLDTLRSLSSQQQPVWVQATGVVIRQEARGVAVIFDRNYQLTAMQPAKE